MTNETPKTTKKPGTWSAARQHLATWDKPALLALVKDLYDAAAGNRNFIHARCQAEDGRRRGAGNLSKQDRGAVLSQAWLRQAQAGRERAKPSASTKRPPATSPARRNC